MNENLIYSADRLHGIINNYVISAKNAQPEISASLNIEYEYKITCSKKSFMALLNNMAEYSSQCELEQTTSIIKNLSTKFKYARKSAIRAKYYFPASKAGVKNTIKERILDASIYKFSNNVKLSVSLEYEQAIKNPIVISEIARIKNRLSFVISDWRYDFTQSVQIKNKDDFNNIQALAAKLFLDLPNYSGKELFGKFISSCENIIIQAYEVEIEYIGVGAPLSDKDAFLNLGKGSYLKIMYDNVIANLASVFNMNPRGIYSQKSLLPAATSITVTKYNEIYPPINYYMSYKADGDRTLLVVYDNECLLLVTSIELILCNGKLCNEDTASNIAYIIEGELIGGTTFLGYDIIMAKKKLVTENIFSDRLAILASTIKEVCEMNLCPSINILAKEAYLITADLVQSFKAVAAAKFPYKSDGYILTTGDKVYTETDNYKIKEHNTIDFLAVKVPKSLAGYFDAQQSGTSQTDEIYLLFNGCSTDNIDRLRISTPPFYDKIFGQVSGLSYVPVLFAPADFPLAYIWRVNKKLDKELSEYEFKPSLRNFKGLTWLFVELDRDHKKNEWRFHKVREDRVDENNYYGNDFVRTAVPTWLSSLNPLKLEDMHMPAQNYFKQGKGNAYFAQTAAISFAKSKLISKFAQYKTVIDLAAGKGQDLNRYITAGYEKALMMDIDKVALLELMSRYYRLTTDKRTKMATAITVLHQDLNEPAETILANIQAATKSDQQLIPANVVICNLALHYLVVTIDNVLNLVTNIKNMLSQNGHFIYTVPDGAKIFELLKKNNGDWVSKENGVVKFRITAMFKDEQFQELGQRVKVKVAFTGDDMYEENLFNVEFINSIFVKHGFKIIEYGSLGDYLRLFAEENSSVYSQLSHDDKLFVSLYSYVIIQKGHPQ